MADQDFWEGGGSLPSPSELRAFLRSEGVSGETASAILNEYDQTIVGGSTTYLWTQDQVNEWVDGKVNEAVAADVSRNEPPDPSSFADEIVSQRQAADLALDVRNRALADQRSEVTSRQVQSYYDQAPMVADAGAAWAAGLAESIALGFRVDENGKILRDEAGNPLPISTVDLWQEIRGKRFNMGALSLPYTGSTKPMSREREELQSQASRRRVFDGSQQRWSKPGQTVTPAQAVALLSSMDEDYLARLQQEMWEAGLYERVAGEGAIPTWGRPDTATRKAFNEVFLEASLNPAETVSQLLDRLANERIQRLKAPETGPGAQAQLPDFNPEVTSEATLGETIDEIARNLRGEFASPEERSSLIKTLQDKEVANQRTLYDRSIADLQSQGAGGGGEDIDRFMAAIAGKESGGNYNAVNKDSGAQGKFQIMPANWPAWAERAGLGANAPRTPGNQEIVARRVMLDYYAQFGNWRDVAVAWYSGPGRVATKRYSDRPQGRYPSINDYANDVMGRFATQGAPQPGDPTYGDINPAIERFDPAAEAAAILKAQDPAGWQSHEYADRAVEFFSLLGGVV